MLLQTLQFQHRGHGGSGVIELAIHLIGEDIEVVLQRQIAQTLQLLARVHRAGGVVGIAN